MDPDAHVNIDSSRQSNLPDGFDHLQAHKHTHVRMVGTIDGHSTDTVVTIAKEFDAHATQLLNMKEMDGIVLALAVSSTWASSSNLL